MNVDSHHDNPARHRPPGAADARAPRRDRRWFALVVVAVAQLMTALDGTVVNIALPSVQSALDFGDADRQWVITAYAVSFAGLLLVGGPPAPSSQAPAAASPLSPVVQARLAVLVPTVNWSRSGSAIRTAVPASATARGSSPVYSAAQVCTACANDAQNRSPRRSAASASGCTSRTASS
ncbi:hypothetical protein OHA72_48095 [Dactylosporangium sp. NBC_01737]|uniref:hypothetical protein n=1 Tax=Dactylosporangium sp. NBC_01737 TaxID=2975959 RepID=UPI002E1057F0|nr:hypothetical protein OHA72_48095 [Dactylosporangium sp. NBC_01737]